MSIEDLEFDLGGKRKRTNEIISEFALGACDTAGTSDDGIVQFTGGMPASCASQTDLKLIVRLVVGAETKEPDVGLRSQARAGATVPGDSRCSRPLVVELVTDATAHRPAVLIVKVQTGNFRSLTNNPAICGAEVHRGDARPVGPFDRSECKPVRSDAGLELEFYRLRCGNIAFDVDRYAATRQRVERQIV